MCSKGPVRTGRLPGLLPASSWPGAGGPAEGAGGAPRAGCRVGAGSRGASQWGLGRRADVGPHPVQCPCDAASVCLGSPCSCSGTFFSCVFMFWLIGYFSCQGSRSIDSVTLAPGSVPRSGRHVAGPSLGRGATLASSRPGDRWDFGKLGLAGDLGVSPALWSAPHPLCGPGWEWPFPAGGCSSPLAPSADPKLSC